jgi:PH (Pleckstrin Homology) domain-containing protein
MTNRRILAGAGVASIVIGAFLSTGPPSLVLLNASLRLQYPWTRGCGALLAGGGALLLTAVFSRLAIRLICGVAAIAAFMVALHLLRYRLEATPAGLVSRDALGTTAIGWKEIRGVDRGSDLILVSGPGETRIRVDTTDFAPEQRASLERTIARHVGEAGGKTP